MTDNPQKGRDNAYAVATCLSVCLSVCHTGVCGEKAETVTVQLALDYGPKCMDFFGDSPYRGRVQWKGVR